MVACIVLALPGIIYEQVTRRGHPLVHGVVYDLVQLMLTGCVRCCFLSLSC